MSKPSKKKQQKKKARERKIRKTRNMIRNNRKEPLFQLEANIDGTWMFVKYLRDESSIDAHVKAMDGLKEKGETVLAGRVRSRNTGKIVREIPPFMPKGTLPNLDMESVKKARLP